MLPPLHVVGTQLLWALWSTQDVPLSVTICIHLILEPTPQHSTAFDTMVA